MWRSGQRLPTRTLDPCRAAVFVLRLRDVDGAQRRIVPPGPGLGLSSLGPSDEEVTDGSQHSHSLCCGCISVRPIFCQICRHVFSVSHRISVISSHLPRQERGWKSPLQGVFQLWGVKVTIATAAALQHTPTWRGAHGTPGPASREAATSRHAGCPLGPHCPARRVCL